MEPIQEYRSRRISDEQAVKVVKRGDWVDYRNGSNLKTGGEIIYGKSKNEYR